MQQVEQREREEEAAGARISVKRRKGKGKSSGRQTKLTSDSVESSSNSLKVTKPSPFAESVEPSVPEFNAQPKTKKPPGSRGRTKKEPGAEADKEPGKTTGKTPEKIAAVKSVKEAFGINDDDPPPSLMERLGTKKQSKLNFPTAPTAKRPKKAQKEVLELDDADNEEEGTMDYDTPPRTMPAKKRVCMGVCKCACMYMYFSAKQDWG